MASRLQKSADALTQDLAQKGVKAGTLKSRIRADIVWQQLIRGRYQSRMKVSDREVVSLLESKNLEARDAVGYDYTLRPILFLVTPGAPASAFEARRREAEALRKSFKGCEENLRAVRAMRDVAVRDQVISSSADLPESPANARQHPARAIDRAEVTRRIEMFAICAKAETKTDTPGRRAARNP
jgi:peptidyl-prolyl cis-trans isomerase SurA